VIDAINVAFQIGIPGSRDKLRQIANSFTRFTGGELWGCVSAIDGWFCKTRKPHQSEVGDVMAYQNRHGCWGLLFWLGVMLIVVTTFFLACIQAQLMTALHGISVRTS
jgi:hypothetical protein